MPGNVDQLRLVQQALARYAALIGSGTSNSIQPQEEQTEGQAPQQKENQHAEDVAHSSNNDQAFVSDASVSSATLDSIASLDKTALLALEEAIMLLPEEERVDYCRAKAEVPLIVQRESNPVWFLKFEKFNTWNAAKRLACYWQERCNRFKERAFLPMNQTGEGALNKADVSLLKTGYTAFLPEDNDGRVVLVSDASRRKKRDNEAAMRLFFYWNQVVLQNPHTTTKGIVIIVLLTKATLDIVGRLAHDRHTVSAKAFPFKNHGVHIICKNNFPLRAFLEEAMGYTAFLPEDNDGRVVLVGDASRRKKRDNEAAMRLFFYWNQVVLQNPHTTTKGIVVIVLLTKASLDIFGRHAHDRHAVLLKAFPWKNHGLHIICKNDFPLRTFLEEAIPMIFSLFPRNKKRKYFHRCGSNEELVEKFQKEYGLSKQSIPDCIGGDWSYEQFLHWRERQIRIEWELPLGVLAESADGFSGDQEQPQLDIKPPKELTEEERKERKRRYNVLHSRRKRRRDRLETQILEKQVEELNQEKARHVQEYTRLQNLRKETEAKITRHNGSTSDTHLSFMAATANSLNAMTNTAQRSFASLANLSASRTPNVSTFLRQRLQPQPTHLDWSQQQFSQRLEESALVNARFLAARNQLAYGQNTPLFTESDQIMLSNSVPQEQHLVGRKISREEKP
eukprot:CAMPEP_0198154754 /NCGR_PEP_ID=MMETSP1443-20131203/68773_1 /TAXON_ID=186043 /ORGANISM="Entomoneis sp., Strain CCMP2396" /LENGTH=676 /DNA_ID=CAMNT_0043821459 /DNA_START=100 /DNA_END=2131 /DNA_ORIENTATION=-